MLAPGSGELAKGTSLLLGHTEGGFRRDAVLFSSHPGAVGLQEWILTHGRSRPPFPSHGHDFPGDVQGTSHSRCCRTSSPVHLHWLSSQGLGGAETEFRGLLAPPSTGQGVSGTFPTHAVQMLWPEVSRKADPKAAPKDPHSVGPADG